MNENPTTAEEQYQLGLCYANGENGISQDWGKAILWFTKAAEQGNSEAQQSLGMYCHQLGLCYAKGDGVSKNMDKAIDCFEKAAKQGYAPSQYRLGLSFMDGWDIPKNPKKAKHWLKEAADNGIEEAKKKLEEFTS